jgi:hypothetical protein
MKGILKNCYFYLFLDVVTTEPNKWPGVASLRALLDREKDEETPNLVFSAIRFSFTILYHSQSAILTFLTEEFF